MGYIMFALLVIILCLWVYSRQQAKKLADSTELLKESAAMIEDLASEIAKRDGIIERNNHMRKYSEGYTESLQRQLKEKELMIQRLRRELQKRTDQYNDLVDLAREKGIIGE